MRAIRVAQMQNGIAVIDAGLSPGERVVVEGQHRLQPGSRVFEVKPDKAAPPNPIVQGNQSAKS
jgi:multidrug efflux system membrane fusion protein